MLSVLTFDDERKMTTYTQLIAPGSAPGVDYVPTNENVDIVMRAGFPIDLLSFQKKAVCELGNLSRMGLYLDVGCGKTYTSLAISFLKLLRNECQHVIVVVPPVLLVNWKRNIERVPHQTSVIYAGNPAQRRKIGLNVQFVVVSLPIFKRDYNVFQSFFSDRSCFVIVDEAQSVKNPGTDNFRKLRDFTIERSICLLTGTPISVPEDAYGLIKLISPTIYHSQYQFESIHVAERDFVSGKPTKYQHLDMLSRNLMCGAMRVLKEDVLLELPEITFTPIYYALESAHYKLYTKLAEEQIIVKTSGEKFDYTNVSALYQALQQVPCNAEHFTDGETKSTILDLVDEIMDELGGRKLVVFCHYRMTTQRLLQHGVKYGAVALWGGLSSPAQRQAVIDKFVSDGECKMLILQYKSGGAGIDSLQEVCSDILTVELPYRSADLRQAVARLHRIGQKSGVQVRIAIAQGTLQVRCWEYVQDNDSLVNAVLRGPQDLRDAIFGR